MYHPHDVIDGGSGVDVLLVGSNEDMDQLFRSDGSLDGNVSNVEMIVSGVSASALAASSRHSDSLNMALATHSFSDVKV